MSSWKQLVKNIAPVIGTALGGPMAGTAIKVLASEFLGDEDAPLASLEKQLATQLQSASPEMLTKLKELDNAFELRMVELGVDVFKLETQDRANARLHNKNSKMPATIVIMLTLLVAAGLTALLMFTIPPENAAIIYMVFGQVMGSWGASIAYWVGTTKSSGDKTQMLKVST
jgi:hypothetical protein